MLSHESDEYYIRVSHEMEAQRHASKAAITAALQSVDGTAVEIADWVRIVDFKYGLHPLSTRGSVTGVGGRFNYGERINPFKYPAFNALYLAEDEETAYREKFGLAKDTETDGLQPHELSLRKPNYVVCHLNGFAINVFDLTKKNLQPFVDAIAGFSIHTRINPALRAAGLSALAPITDPSILLKTIYHPYWEGWPRQHGIPANGQEFGRLALEAGFDGVLYDSTKSGKRCLALFPQQFEGGVTFVEIDGNAPAECVHRRIDATNWRDFV